MPRADQAPQQAEQDQASDAIAGSDMQLQYFIFAAQVCRREARDLRPVNRPHQRAPYDNLAV